ncbi:uncharacterized protein [Anabrus simplex]|uniref:uncharacterized protein n=1 Tax=Anabrus simplex TaxID=316456 RepID=UPI0035A32CEB
MNTFAALVLLVGAANAASVFPVDSSVVHSTRSGDSFSYSIQQSRAAVPVTSQQFVPLVYDSIVPIGQHQVVLKDNKKNVKDINEGIVYINGQQVELKEGQHIKPIILKGGQQIKPVQKPGVVYPFYPGGVLVKDGEPGKEEEIVFLTYPSNVIPIGQPAPGASNIYGNPALYPNYAFGFPYNPLTYNLINKA